MEQKLIESALWLTGKTPLDMRVTYKIDKNTRQIVEEFSIEKFCYYLLSPSFIEKYAEIINWEYYFVWQEERMSATIWKAIYEYQTWNEQPLIDLLNKIK